MYVFVCWCQIYIFYVLRFDELLVLVDIRSRLRLLERGLRWRIRLDHSAHEVALVIDVYTEHERWPLNANNIETGWKKCRIVHANRERINDSADCSMAKRLLLLLSLNYCRMESPLGAYGYRMVFAPAFARARGIQKCFNSIRVGHEKRGPSNCRRPKASVLTRWIWPTSVG